MERQWTDNEVHQWIARRDKYRERKSLPPLSTLRQDDPKAYQIALKAEKDTLLSRLNAISLLKLAWPLEKSPLQEYPAPCSGKLILPNNHRQSHGFSTIQFHTGDDLNFLVHQFYQEKVASDYAGYNSVSSDPLCNKRHEYMGPCPHVVGYRFDRRTGTAEIEWYDSYLVQSWCGVGTWKFEAYLDHKVEGWVSRARGDYCANLDWNEYLGLEK